MSSINKKEIKEAIELLDKIRDKIVEDFAKMEIESFSNEELTINEAIKVLKELLVPIKNCGRCGAKTPVLIDDYCKKCNDET